MNKATENAQPTPTLSPVELVDQAITANAKIAALVNSPPQLGNISRLETLTVTVDLSLRKALLQLQQEGRTQRITPGSVWAEASVPNGARLTVFGMVNDMDGTNAKVCFSFDPEIYYVLNEPAFRKRFRPLTKNETR